MDKKHFSAYIKKTRAKADMTLHEFGSAIGTTWVTIWRWENAECMPRPEAMKHWKDKIDAVLRANQKSYDYRRRTWGYGAL